MTEIYCPECADLLNRDHCCPCCGWSERAPEHYRDYRKWKKTLRRKMRSRDRQEDELLEEGGTV